MDKRSALGKLKGTVNAGRRLMCKEFYTAFTYSQHFKIQLRIEKNRKSCHCFILPNNITWTGAGLVFEHFSNSCHNLRDCKVPTSVETAQPLFKSFQKYLYCIVHYSTPITS